VVLKPFLGCIRSGSQWIYLQLQLWRVVRDVIGDLVDAVRARLQRVFSLCQLKNSVRTNHTVYVLICHCISDLVRAQCMVGLPAVTHLIFHKSCIYRTVSIFFLLFGFLIKISKGFKSCTRISREHIRGVYGFQVVIVIQLPELPNFQFWILKILFWIICWSPNE